LPAIGDPPQGLGVSPGGGDGGDGGAGAPGCGSRPGGCSSDVAGRRSGQPFGQQEPGPVQAPLHRLLGNPDHCGRLGMSQPLDADQVEDLALVLR
jgi:hypothetical protein